MNKLISQSLAGKILITLFVMVSLFHLSVMTGIIPYDVAWGGRLKSINEMLVFETISIFINLVLIFFIAMQIGMINKVFSPGVIKVFLWIFVFIFLMNTVGNFFAVNKWERLIATPLTFISAILLLRIVLVSEK